MKPLGADYVNTSHARDWHWPHTHTNQEQEINFVWPRIVPHRRRCPSVRRHDKGGFTVVTTFLQFRYRYMCICEWAIFKSSVGLFCTECSLLSEEGPQGGRSKHGKVLCIWKSFAYKYIYIQCTCTMFNPRDGLLINYYPALTSFYPRAQSTLVYTEDVTTNTVCIEHLHSLNCM